MNLTILPPFWISLSVGTLWLGAGLLLSEPVAVLLGFGPLLFLWVSYQRERHLNIATHSETSSSRTLELGKKASLTVTLPNNVHGPFTFDHSGVPMDGLNPLPVKTSGGVSWQVQGERLGNTQVHGLWCTESFPHGLFQRRLYVPLMRSFVWVPPNLLKDTPRMAPRREIDDMGEARPWQFGDRLRDIDVRATQRYGKRIARPRSVGANRPEVAVMGPLEALYGMEQSVFCAWASTFQSFIERRAQAELHLYFLGERGVLGTLNGPALGQWLKNLSTHAEKAWNAQRVRNGAKPDPHIIREHLLATRRVKPGEVWQPSALLRGMRSSLSADFSIQSSSLVESYWHSHQLGHMPVSRPLKGGLMKSWEEIRRSAPPGSSFHWWSVGLNKEDMNWVDKRLIRIHEAVV